MDPTSSRGRRGTGRRRRDRRARRDDGVEGVTQADTPTDVGAGAGGDSEPDASTPRPDDHDGHDEHAGGTPAGDGDGDGNGPEAVPGSRDDAEPAALAAAFQVLLDRNPLGALVIQDARVLHHNDRAATLLGTHPDDLDHGRFGHLVRPEPYELARRDLDGRSHTLTIESTPLPALGADAWLVTITDAADRHPDADGDEHFGSSTHDLLTGLPERELLLNHLFDQARRSPADDEDRVAVIVVDLERFVRVNEEHGHDAGDRVLQTVAARLTSVVRPGDYVSRSGDDEFAIVLAPQPVSAHLGVAERVVEVLSGPVVVDDVEIYCTPVVGVAEHVAGDDEHDVLGRAEEAMVAGAPGAAHLAPRPTDEPRSRQASLAPHVIGAVDEDQLYLHFQPIVTLGSNQLIALEALARWEHPDDGLVEPDDLVRVATEDGTETSIGEWVLAEVCEQIATWRADHPDFLVPTVHVNVSARQAGSSGLRRTTNDELARWGLAPPDLRFEITEDVLIDPDPRVGALLRDLASDGIELVLDQFGTGVASLTHLRRAPLVGLKIDRSFVSRITTDEPSAQLVLAAIDTARAFLLPVTAVGIEDEEQQAVLERWGCDLGQGDALARPMTAIEVTRLFERDPTSVRARPRGPLLRSSGTFVSPISRS